MKRSLELPESCLVSSIVISVTAALHAPYTWEANPIAWHCV